MLGSLRIVATAEKCFSNLSLEYHLLQWVPVLTVGNRIGIARGLVRISGLLVCGQRSRPVTSPL